jgi:MFS family permease
MEEEAQPGPSQVQPEPESDSAVKVDFKSKNEKVNNVREVSPGGSSLNSSSVESIAEIVPKPLFPPYSPLREPVFVGLTKRQVTILAVFGLSEFFGAMVYAVHAPYFPKQATRKGVTASQFGFSFGAFEFAILIFSPILGNLMRKGCCRPNVMYHFGVLTAGIAAVVFSLLAFTTNSTTFLVGSIVIRAVEGIGQAAFITASYSIIAEEFADAITTTFVSMQTFFGLGMISGPVIGGALFDAYLDQDFNFLLTFGVLGGILLLSAIVGLVFLPRSEILSHELEGRKSIRGGQILGILRIGSVRLAAFSIASAALSIGFLSAILELHLRQFAIHPVLLGGIFVINGGLYALSAPFFGWILEKCANPKYLILFGADLIIVGFLLIGPASFIPLQTSVLVTCIGLACHGLGLGAVLVASFNLSLKKAVEFGYETNIVTYGIVSSLWMAMFSIGSSIGPSVGGILYDNIEFKDSSWIVFGTQLLLSLVTILSIWNNKGRESEPSPARRNRDFEGKPLLFSSSKSTLKGEEDEHARKYGATNT